MKLEIKDRSLDQDQDVRLYLEYDCDMVYVMVDRNSKIGEPTALLGFKLEDGKVICTRAAEVLIFTAKEDFPFEVEDKAGTYYLSLRDE